MQMWIQDFWPRNTEQSVRSSTKGSLSSISCVSTIMQQPLALAKHVPFRVYGLCRWIPWPSLWDLSWCRRSEMSLCVKVTQSTRGAVKYRGFLDRFIETVAQRILFMKCDAAIFNESAASRSLGSRAGAIVVMQPLVRSEKTDKNKYCKGREANMENHLWEVGLLFLTLFYSLSLGCSIQKKKEPVFICLMKNVCLQHGF